MRRERPLNLVIILEESPGATFVESLGGVPVTPEIEKLKKEGWWFEQLYATGTRSVRGIEAVTTEFLPTPAQAVVKLVAGAAQLLDAGGHPRPAGATNPNSSTAANRISTTCAASSSPTASRR